RAVTGIGVLWGAATLTFVMMQLSSGDIAIAILGGPDALPSPEVLARVRQAYGLDKPLIVQYADYLARAASLDFGESYRLRIPVLDAIRLQLPATARLALIAGITTVTCSVLIATLTARRSPWLKSVISGTELLISSAPGFVIGLLLLYVFSFSFGLLPAAGYRDLRSLILPTLTLSIPTTMVLSQVLRQELEDILEQPFIVTARSRGLSEAAVRYGHALRHALIPLVTLSGFIFANLLGGTVIIESLFSQQGIGRLMSDSTNSKDVPVVLAIVLLAAATYVVVHLIVDILNGIIDPRHRTH
ncbi:MAG TPA: ABC transporter permease, partial [Polyangiaceae bacterium]|nr:ABC transporter permease [Polyangiaceae bacterium]